VPEEAQADVSYRIATMDNISPQLLRELEEAGQVTTVRGDTSDSFV
jgi:flagellar motor switch protein FliG